ncbi:MAG: hypothetical protein V4820_19645 [Pseudomonadota bacterium]
MSLAGHSAFQRLWAAQPVSAFSARITREGLPIMAVVSLDAGVATLGCWPRWARRRTLLIADLSPLRDLRESTPID